MNINNKYIFNRVFILSLLIVYALIISFISYHHELWRDEVRALSIVTASNSIADLFSNIQNEGHPALWYIILYTGYSLTHNLEVLKIIHIIIAIISLFLVLKYAPISKLNLILFIFSYFIIYEYAVINRNYSISMLLLFMYCSVYKNRLKKIIPVSIILFLLANTNAHSIIFTIMFLVFLVRDYISEKNSTKKVSIHIFITGCLIILTGIIFSIFQIIPDKSTIVTNLYSMNAFEIFKNIIKAIVIPGESYRTLFGINNFIISSILIWILAISLLKRKKVFYFFLFTLFGLSLFFKLVYPSTGPRHEGFLFLLIISSYWIENNIPQEFIFSNTVLEKISDFLLKKKEIILTLFLILQIYNSYNAVIMDISQEYSSAKALGNMLDNSFELNNAIVICEPDYLIESLPYYSDNPIYFVRENKFGAKVNFTKESKPTISLVELIESAKQLKKIYKKNIVLLFGYKLNAEGPYNLNAGFSRKFIYSKEQYNIFSNNTKRISEFHNSKTDENYDVYLLKNQD